MIATNRSLTLAALVVTCAGCHARIPITALPSLAPAIRPVINHLVPGVDSVQVTVRASLHNPLSDTLTLDTTCGGVAFRLEYADGSDWRPATDGLRVRQCLAMYTEVRVAPGDSIALADVIIGRRGVRAIGVRWVAPIAARYRVTATASRCIRNTRRDCWVTLASTPFDVSSASAEDGGA